MCVIASFQNPSAKEKNLLPRKPIAELQIRGGIADNLKIVILISQ